MEAGTVPVNSPVENQFFCKENVMAFILLMLLENKWYERLQKGGVTGQKGRGQSSSGSCFLGGSLRPLNLPSQYYIVAFVRRWARAGVKVR